MLLFQLREEVTFFTIEMYEAEFSSQGLPGPWHWSRIARFSSLAYCSGRQVCFQGIGQCYYLWVLK